MAVLIFIHWSSSFLPVRRPQGVHLRDKISGASHQNPSDPQEDQVILHWLRKLASRQAWRKIVLPLAHWADVFLSLMMSVGLQGVIGETYNIGTQKERQVVEVARDIAARFRLGDDKIVKVKDRAFNDQRCALPFIHYVIQAQVGHARRQEVTSKPLDK